MYLSQNLTRVCVSRKNLYETSSKRIVVIDYKNNVDFSVDKTLLKIFEIVIKKKKKNCQLKIKKHIYFDISKFLNH